jgi:RNA polymerase sigma-70 factor (ECF subfamily)
MAESAGGLTVQKIPSTASTTGPPSLEDKEILEALGRDDRCAATTLCARHHGAAIGRLCMALLGSQAEADDLTQETLMVAHDAFDSYRAEGSLKAWLFGIARRRCARHLERSSHRQAKLRLVFPHETGAEAEELLERRRRAEHARKALEELRPSDREALLLRYLGELSYRDLGVACAIEETAARQRVSRALARLREVLKTEG